MTNQTKGSRPAYDIWVVEPPKNTNDPDAKGFFTKIGGAWPNRAGNGFNIKLNALPLDGQLVMLPPKEEEQEDPPPQQDRRQQRR